MRDLTFRDRLRTYCVPNTLWLLLFTIGLGWFLMGMPKCLDDYWFCTLMRPWLESHGHLFLDDGVNLFETGVPWRQLLDSWSFRVNYDNARLGNLLVQIFLILPKWIGAAISLLSWLYTMWGTFRLAGIDWRRSPLVPLAIFLWTFFMPWRNYMSSLDYQFNYIPPSALVVLLLVQLFSQSRCRPFRTGFTAFLIGWWHEGFGVPVAGALAFLILFRKECRERKYYSAFCGVMLALLLLLLAPSSYSRINRVFAEDQIYYWGILLGLLLNAVHFLFLALCVIRCREIFSSGRSRRDLIVFIIVCGLVSVIIMCRTYGDARVTWPAHLLAILGILSILRGIKPRWPRLRVFANASMLIVSFASWALVGYYVSVIRTDMFAAEKQFAIDNTQPFFGRVPEESPLALNMPDPSFYTTTVFIINSFRDDYERQFRIIPRELEYVTSEDGVPIEGDLGPRIFKGRIFIPMPGEEDLPIINPDFDADYGRGYVRCPGFVIPFVSKADGKKYMWVYICSNWYYKHFYKLRRLRLATDSE